MCWRVCMRLRNREEREKPTSESQLHDVAGHQPSSIIFERTAFSFGGPKSPTGVSLYSWMSGRKASFSVWISEVGVPPGLRVVRLDMAPVRCNHIVDRGHQRRGRSPAAQDPFLQQRVVVAVALGGAICAKVVIATGKRDDRLARCLAVPV